ncbi:hypothetical protein D3C87_1980160 [compost metagenome]
MDASDGVLFVLRIIHRNFEVRLGETTFLVESDAEQNFLLVNTTLDNQFSLIEVLSKVFRENGLDLF